MNEKLGYKYARAKWRFQFIVYIKFLVQPDRRIFISEKFSCFCRLWWHNMRPNPATYDSE